MRTYNPVPARAKKLHMLRRCLSKLRALHVEALAILNALLKKPAARVVHGLCTRFHVLQVHFALLYREAKAHALSALGRVPAALSFP